MVVCRDWRRCRLLLLSIVVDCFDRVLHTRQERRRHEHCRRVWNSNRIEHVWRRICVDGGHHSARCWWHLHFDRHPHVSIVAGCVDTGRQQWAGRLWSIGHERARLSRIAADACVKSISINDKELQFSFLLRQCVVCVWFCLLLRKCATSILFLKISRFYFIFFIQRCLKLIIIQISNSRKDILLN